MSATTVAARGEKRPAVAADPGRREALKAYARRNVMPPLLAFLALVVVWELISRTEIVDPIVLPPPTDIVAALFGLLGEAFFWDAAKVTVSEVFAGFAIGAGLGFVIGALIASVELFRSTFYPFALALNNLPRIVFAPLLLTWFGFGVISKIVMAAAICFFPVLIGTVVGIDTVDKEARMLMRSFGASRWKTFRSLTFPSSLPMIFAGIVTAMAYALVGAIVAEFVGAKEGLGVLIKEFNFHLQVADSFAVIILLTLLGLALYGVLEALYRRIVFWEHR